MLQAVQYEALLDAAGRLRAVATAVSNDGLALSNSASNLAGVAFAGAAASSASDALLARGRRVQAMQFVFNSAATALEQVSELIIEVFPLYEETVWQLNNQLSNANVFGVRIQTEYAGSFPEELWQSDLALTDPQIAALLHTLGDIEKSVRNAMDNAAAQLRALAEQAFLAAEVAARHGHHGFWTGVGHFFEAAAPILLVGGAVIVTFASDGAGAPLIAETLGGAGATDEAVQLSTDEATIVDSNLSADTSLTANEITSESSSAMSEEYLSDADKASSLIEHIRGFVDHNGNYVGGHILNEDTMQYTGLQTDSNGVIKVDTLSVLQEDGSAADKLGYDQLPAKTITMFPESWSGFSDEQVTAQLRGALDNAIQIPNTGVWDGYTESGIPVQFVIDKSAGIIRTAYPIFTPVEAQ